MDTRIEKARMRHGDFYDYSKVTYNKVTEPVKIICPLHGEFTQVLYHHINGSGCNKCKLDKLSKLHRLPLKEFIQRATVIHDGKYDYSKVIYRNNRDRIIVICPKHGEFTQILSGHLTGYGCYNCAKESKFLTTEEFIKRSTVIHNNQYDYSKVNYTDSRDRVTVICPKHGEFRPTAAAHMSGAKCSECSREDRYLTKAQFIEKSVSVHGDLYDYSKVNYSGARTKVTIICSDHGEFTQIPNSHLGGAGCPLCSVDRSRVTKEEFIERANLIHNNKYQYDKINYINTVIKVNITCPEHGDFTQTPNSHLYGSGCYDCGLNSLKLTEEEFIERANLIHNNRYTYPNLNYINIKTKVTITCGVHGDFDQIPKVHLIGSGCSKCSSSKGELTIGKILDDNNIKYYKEYTLPETDNKFRYDFYLPEYNLLIEFHGIQHYQAVEYFGGEEIFNYTKRNDAIKRHLSVEFKYRLIEFNYKHLETLTFEEFQRLVLKKLSMINK